MEHYTITATIRYNFVGLKSGMDIKMDIPKPYDEIGKEIEKKYGIQLSGKQVKGY